ncbi:MAG: hypothetical protein Aurels2KO_40820 [Aureliella sp.]
MQSAMQPAQLQDKHIVLLGVGHTNAHVVRKWMMDPIPDASLTCVSNFLSASYSGILPAVLAGQVPREEMEIDLVKLCSVAGARLITNPVTGIDAEAQNLLFADRPPMQYDVLSIGIGSKPLLPPVELKSADAQLRCLMIKPMQTFMQRLESAVASAVNLAKGCFVEVAVVGSGAAGVEIACCLVEYLRSISERFKVKLVSRSSSVLADSSRSLQNRVADALVARGVESVTDFEVLKCTESETTSQLCLQNTIDDAHQIEADIVIWATGATPPPLLQKLDLPLDGRGFLQTDASLRCAPHTNIFAVGDSGSFDQQTPKAGVYAVRQGPVLWDNIRRTLDGQPTVSFRPQRDFLKLINLGNDRAIMSWRGISSTGPHAWWLKKRIDTAFLEKYRPQPMDADPDMQCAGCGCKLGSLDLNAALEKSGAAGPPEDAVELTSDGGLIASVDFFSCPVPDPFLNGRISALHAASDIVACGGKPEKALAMVVVPEGPRHRLTQWLTEFLAGAEVELNAMGGELAAGHTIVGPRAEAGFTIVGSSPPDSFRRKSGAAPGDAIVLTKPLGTGIALAAHSRGLCDAVTWRDAVDNMLLRQHGLIEQIDDLEIHAMTDVTGFGLAGHLLEVLSSSQVSATVDVQAVPAIAGVENLIGQGVLSSLYQSNFEACRSQIQWEVHPSVKTELLFDPQTCGGMLIALPESQATTLVRRCNEIGIAEATIIGRVEQKDATNQQRLTLR